ncbi:hypothetical protein BC833DRAFT_36396 [Globomyces pollinis-pini]|nr:hypothetical protein BC833DRAFT_36396 [Globomyces pollinis-pini]
MLVRFNCCHFCFNHCLCLHPSWQRHVSLLEIVCLLGLVVPTSRDRSSIPWYTVETGFLFLQFVIALFVLQTSIGQQIFKYKINIFIWVPQALQE